MKSARFLIGAFCIAGVLTLGGCKAEVKTDAKTGEDTAAVTVDPAVKDDVAGEAIQAKVSAALVAAAGFENVDVESSTQGVIVLNGTVASEDEKGKAEMIAKNIEGVTTVTNNLTVAAK